MTNMKKAINKETGAEYKVLMSMTRFTDFQMMMISAIIAFYDALVAGDVENKIDDETRKRYAQRMYRRSELIRSVLYIRANDARFDSNNCVYYLTKNQAMQSKGMYDLKRAKLAKAADAPKETKQVSAKREAAPKREAKQIEASSDVNTALALLS